MNEALVIRGRFTNKAFVSDDPMPDVEGPAELIVHSPMPAHGGNMGKSMFDFFGKAPHPRSAKEINLQVGEERDSWNGA